MRAKKRTGYMISAVAETYRIHPQTLRLYERLGLLKPSRTEGNTRLYIDRDLERLEIILSLTRDMGVNLAGVEVVLNMRDKMQTMQKEFDDLVSYVNEHWNPASRIPGSSLVRVPASKIVRSRR